MRERASSHIGPDTRLIVVKLVIVISIQHAVYLQDVGVGVGARKFVARAVETQYEFLSRLSLAETESGLDGQWLKWVVRHI